MPRSPESLPDRKTFTPLQLAAVAALAHNGPMLPSGIDSRQEWEPGTAIGVLRRLERAGIVERIGTPSGTHFGLTERVAERVA